MAHATDPDTSDAVSAEGMQWVSGLAALVGVLIAVAPFVLGGSAAITWNNVIVGAAIVLIAGTNAFRLHAGRRMVVGAMAFVAVLFVWTVVAPFAIETGAELLLWTNVVAGIIGLAVAAIVANAGRGVDARVGETTE